MSVKSDEQVLYESYLKLGKKLKDDAMKTSSVSLEEDKELVEEINSKLSLMLVYLDETNILSASEVQKQLIKAKEMYVQLFKVKGRNPECIMGYVNNKMDRLMHAVARHEAYMIQSIRKQEGISEGFDLEELFDQEKNLRHLGTTPIRNVVKDAMNNYSVSMDNKSEIYYITVTGKKYHIGDCPYCRGKKLNLATKAIIEDQKLIACKCVALKKVANQQDKNTVTAFVDESIRSIQWVDGGKTGSYSYIICKGRLTSEKDIEDSQIIAQGIDYMHESNHTERLTEAAIGKVMMTLAYDYNFKGNVQIFTDNKAAMGKWGNIPQNSRLATLFKSVTVKYIPRKENTRADKLGKSYTYLNIPTRTYKDIAAKVRAYDKIQEEKEQQAYIAKQQENQTEIPMNSPKEKNLLDKVILGFRSVFNEGKLKIG